ncbi:MAG: hypothetical protein K0B85_09580, partial [Coriobacteriia bacterium]|nr:hypothetical protein [Coriobacteriia bacterium]
MDHVTAPDAASDPAVTAPPRHSRVRRVVAWVLLGLLAALLFVPLLWPVPEVPGAVEPQELAGPDSLFIELGGVEHHYVLSGTGGRVVIFLHGFGASTFSWRDTLPDVAARATAIAFDRPGFGLTERK